MYTYVTGACYVILTIHELYLQSNKLCMPPGFSDLATALITMNHFFPFFPFLFLFSSEMLQNCNVILCHAMNTLQALSLRSLKLATFY